MSSSNERKGEMQLGTAASLPNILIFFACHDERRHMERYTIPWLIKCSHDNLRLLMCQIVQGRISCLHLCWQAARQSRAPSSLHRNRYCMEGLSLGLHIAVHVGSQLYGLQCSGVGQAAQPGAVAAIDSESKASVSQQPLKGTHACSKKSVLL